MDYPLSMRFKVFGLAPQIFVSDSRGNSVFYVKQRLFKLKEAVKVYRDNSRAELMYEINADRIMDFSARYHFRDTEGRAVGAVGRQGMKSLFRATYDIYEGDNKVMSLSEESVAKRILERFLGGIPIIGFVVILLINPSYIVRSNDGEPLFRLNKLPAFFEGKFSIDKLRDTLTADEEIRAVLAMLMLSLLERARG